MLFKQYLQVFGHVLSDDVIGPTKRRGRREAMKEKASGRYRESHELVWWICLVLVQWSLCVFVYLLLFTQSRYCMLVSDLLLALSHLRLLTPTTDSFPIFCTSHVPLPTPTVKLENLFGAIQTQMIYPYVVIILLLTEEWMYTSTDGLGCYFSFFVLIP